MFRVAGAEGGGPFQTSVTVTKVAVTPFGGGGHGPTSQMTADDRAWTQSAADDHTVAVDNVRKARPP